VDRFVARGGSPYIIRYNSSLPIVVYVPEGMEVRYRAGSKSDETGLMDIVAWNVLTTRTTVKRTGSNTNVSLLTNGNKRRWTGT
jgi:hypothetical protein